MNEVQLTQLRHDLQTVLVRRFCDVPRYGVFAEQGNPLSERFVSIMYGADRRPLAFATVKPVAVRFAGSVERAALMGLAAIAERVPREQVLRLLYFPPLVWMLIAGGLRTFAVAAATMHPALVELMTRYLSHAQPDYREPRPPGAHVRVFARQLVEQHGKDFGADDLTALDADRLVVRNSYQGACAPLKRDFDALRPARDERCNAFCRAMLDYRRGDDLLVIGWADWPAAWRNLRSLLPGFRK
jgi:hypothetical protein